MNTLHLNCECDLVDRSAWRGEGREVALFDMTIPQAKMFCAALYRCERTYGTKGKLGLSFRRYKRFVRVYRNTSLYYTSLMTLGDVKFQLSAMSRNKRELALSVYELTRYEKGLSKIARAVAIYDRLYDHIEYGMLDIRHKRPGGNITLSNGEVI